jgi:hypothetical protein
LQADSEEPLTDEEVMEVQFDENMAMDDTSLGFRSVGAVADSGHLSGALPDAASEPLEGSSSSDLISDNMLQMPPVATAVPLLQVPRGKVHGYSDYMGRESSRSGMQTLRMPVVHEEGESIAGSHNTEEEQPPEPGAVSVSGRQV